ncbi:hypothetical protein CATMIT_01778, partial [Catenibacterium mitsuokai DSM 15897]
SGRLETAGQAGVVLARIDIVRVVAGDVADQGARRQGAPADGGVHRVEIVGPHLQVVRFGLLVGVAHHRVPVLVEAVLVLRVERVAGRPGILPGLAEAARVAGFS